MQNRIFITAISSLLLFAASCSDNLKDKVKLDVRVDTESATLDGDVYVVTKSTPVTFLFSGDPDFMSFYSGEPGREYSKRSLTESPVDEITSVLELSTKTQYGSAASVAGTLKVMLSTEFEGLYKGTQKNADSLKVEAINWIDITEQCQVSQLPGKTSPVVQIPLNEYLGKRLTIAFLYHTTVNVSAQPVWEILDLKVVNTDKNTNLKSNFTASFMGFTPLDMYADANSAYNTVSNNTSGVWNLSGIAASAPKMRIHSSSAGAALNKDWLISNPIVVNSRTPDSGVGIKNISSRVDKYIHTYHNEGEYTITFIASNVNMEHESSVVKEVKIRVVAN